MAERMESKALLSHVLTAAAPHGVTKAGVCSLGALSRLLPCRGRALLPQSGSVILLLLPYYTGSHQGRNLSLYAVPDDYHAVAQAILTDVAAALRTAYPKALFLPFVDSSPIPEVEAAELAGLGFRGRNNQLVTPEYGSTCFICELVTDMELDGVHGAAVRGGCAGCRRCLDACPTHALSEKGFDPARCRSAITQKKGELNDWEREQVRCGGLVWGCDICLEACPHNAHPPQTTVDALRRNLLSRLDHKALQGERVAVKSYLWRGRGVLERNLDILCDNDERK